MKLYKEKKAMYRQFLCILGVVALENEIFVDNDSFRSSMIRMFTVLGMPFPVKNWFAYLGTNPGRRTYTAYL